MSVEVHKIRNSTPGSPLVDVHGSCSGTDSEVKESVAHNIKQEPKEDNEMKSFAQNTMNELLGLYGYERVADGELSRYGSGSINTSSHGASDDDSLSTISHENLRDAAPKQSARRKRAERRGHNSSIVDMLDSTINNKQIAKRTSYTPTHRAIGDGIHPTNPISPHASGSCDDEILCSWCRKPGRSALTLQENDVRKSFCSEKCFAACRRANFKRTRVCDWCKQIRQVREYLDDSQNDGRLQFCSAECLDSYKMAVFCSEIKNTDKANCSSPNSSEACPEAERAKEKLTPNVDLMDLRLGASSSAEQPGALTKSDLTNNSGIHKKNWKETIYKSKGKRANDSEIRSQSRDDKINNLSERCEKMRVANEVPPARRNGALKDRFNVSHRYWKKGDKSSSDWKNAGSLVEDDEKEGFNPVNLSLLANTYASPNFQNMHAIQNLASVGLLGYKSPGLLPNLAARVPLGAVLPNGILPAGLVERQHNVESFDPNSFILGMLAAGSSKFDTMLSEYQHDSEWNPEVTSRVSPDARSQSNTDSSPSVTRCPNTLTTLTNDRLVSNAANKSVQNAKLPTRRSGGHQSNGENAPQFPFPTLLVPFPVPLPIPIPMPIKNNRPEKLEHKQTSTFTNEEEKACQGKNGFVESVPKVCGSTQSAIDLSCKSKSTFLCESSDKRTRNSETIEEDLISPSPHKKFKLST